LICFKFPFYFFCLKLTANLFPNLSAPPKITGIILSRRVLKNEFFITLLYLLYLGKMFYNHVRLFIEPLQKKDQAFMGR